MGWDIGMSGRELMCSPGNIRVWNESGQNYCPELLWFSKEQYNPCVCNTNMHTGILCHKKIKIQPTVKTPEAAQNLNVIYIMEHFLCGLKNKSKATQVQSSSPLSLSSHGHHSYVVPVVVDFPVQTHHILSVLFKGHKSGLHSPEGLKILTPSIFQTKSATLVLYFSVQQIINNAYLIYGMIPY